MKARLYWFDVIVCTLVAAYLILIGRFLPAIEEYGKQELFGWLTLGLIIAGVACAVRIHLRLKKKSKSYVA